MYQVYKTDSLFNFEGRVFPLLVGFVHESLHAGLAQRGQINLKDQREWPDMRNLLDITNYIPDGLGQLEPLPLRRSGWLPGHRPRN